MLTTNQNDIFLIDHNNVVAAHVEVLHMNQSGSWLFQAATLEWLREALLESNICKCFETTNLEATKKKETLSAKLRE